MRLALFAALMLVSTNVLASECRVSDFEIESLRPTADNPCRQSPCPVVRLPAEVRSNCAFPAGVMVKITARDSTGAVLATAEGWPAGTRNIPAGETYAFDFGSQFTYSNAIDRFEANVVDVRTWR